MPKKVKEENKEIKINSDEIKKDIMAYVDSRLDEKLEKVVGDKIRKEVNEEVDSAYKKIIRSKNRKIFVKNIFLLLFFAIILFLIYLLYTAHYFDPYLLRIVPQGEVVETEEEVLPPPAEIVEPTLEDLIAKYGDYLTPYVMSDKSIYVESFYEGNLTKEVKNFMSLNSMNFDQLEVEEDYNVIEGDTLLRVCNGLFNDCSNVPFDYNGNKIRYFEKLESFVTNSVLEREDTNIVREIIDIQVDKKDVVITTIEGVVIDNQIYRAYPSELLDEYYGDGLVNYKDSLNVVKYVFKNQKLVQVEKG